jgi:hypothetical protein
MNSSTSSGAAAAGAFLICSYREQLHSAGIDLLISSAMSLLGKELLLIVECPSFGLKV